MSQRTSLAGLDDYTADGAESFDVLENLVSSLPITKSEQQQIITQLHNAKRYLKIGFSLNLSLQSNVSSHCVDFALSDSNPKSDFYINCNHHHNNDCENCENLVATLTQITELIRTSSNPKKDEWEYDCTASINKIYEWQKHLVRHFVQSKSKNDILNNLKPDAAFWLRDWSMKILPMEYREKASSWFGKRGMSQEVDVFWTPSGKTTSDGQQILQKYVYVTMLDQSSGAQIYLTKYICQQNGFTLKRIDFNEAGKGKDQCDRESACTKTHRDYYVSSGNNVTTALQMKQAAESNGGVKDTKVAVVNIDENKKSLKLVKLKDSTQYHSYEFGNNNVRAWKQYATGSGRLLKLPTFEELQFKSGLTVISQFPPLFSQGTKLNPAKQSSQQRKPSSKKSSVLFCSDLHCVLTFADTKELEQHIKVNQHEYFQENAEVQSLPIIEKAKIYFIDHLKGATNIINSTTHSTTSSSTSSVTKKSHSNSIWIARDQLYERGEKTKKKVSPAAAADLMRTEIDNKNNKLFRPHQYLNKKQIANYFSSKKREPFQYPSSAVDEENDDDAEDEEAAQRQQQQLDDDEPVVTAKASYYRTRTAYTAMTNRESTDEEEASDKEQDFDETVTSGEDTDPDGLQEAEESP
ncbi:unnamed protein product [Rotaria sp. Silwood1]|nr:unnamed protein product [Rotaria sp. Silwood1]